MKNSNTPENRPEVEVPARLTTIDGRAANGAFMVRELSLNDQVAAALKWVGIMWLIAVVCVLLPVIHFVLVPTFLILGVVLGIKAGKETRRIESGRADCPNCGKQIDFTRERYREAYKDHCPHCLHELYVRLTP